MLCGFTNLTIDFALHLIPVTELIPQTIDFVEYDQAPFVGAVFMATDVVAPYFDIGFGNTSVGRKHKKHRVRTGQQIQGQFGLRAKGV